MTLENLARIQLLKVEKRDAREFAYMVQSAIAKLRDAQNAALSFDSRFELAYSAAHSLALAALRHRGFRSDKRYLVFQCLAHTVEMDPATVREFDNYHHKRNLAEYEGGSDPDERVLAELVANTTELLKKVQKLTPPD
jgi:hypothetical protein